MCDLCKRNVVNDFVKHGWTSVSFSSLISSWRESFVLLMEFCFLFGITIECPPLRNWEWKVGALLLKSSNALGGCLDRQWWIVLGLKPLPYSLFWQMCYVIFTCRHFNNTSAAFLSTPHPHLGLFVSWLRAGHFSQMELPHFPPGNCSFCSGLMQQVQFWSHGKWKLLLLSDLVLVSWNEKHLRAILAIQQRDDETRSFRHACAVWNFDKALAFRFCKHWSWLPSWLWPGCPLQDHQPRW